MPSYNMEKYLNRCIDSFLAPEILDRLELIIVNDGSTDKTLSIANEYRSRYPQTIVVIDKPNGHYGSCVNASLKVATGKYFRIVDADDWVDSNALVTFINKLETIDVDCVCTKYTTHNFKKKKVLTENVDVPPDVIWDLNKEKIPMKCMHMHSLSFALDLLKRINYYQTEGICYTDTEYVYIPLSSSKNMFYIDVSLYQYYIGRDDQSMDKAVLNKNYKQMVQVNERLLKVHKSNLNFNANENLIWSYLVYWLLFFTLPSYLLSRTFDNAIDETLRESIKEMNQLNTYKPSPLFKNRVHGIPFVSIWYRTPSLYRLISHLL